MIADSFEIDGDEIDIHIIDNKTESCFSVFARNQNNQLVNGFEFRIKKFRDMEVESFTQSPTAFAIISFMRHQIEENHWQAYREELIGSHISGSPRCATIREQGRDAFLRGQHYCNNPFTDLNVQAHDEWDRGWAEAAHQNPALFDFTTDSFVTDDVIEASVTH